MTDPFLMLTARVLGSFPSVQSRLLAISVLKIKSRRNRSITDPFYDIFYKWHDSWEVIISSHFPEIEGLTEEQYGRAYTLWLDGGLPEPWQEEITAKIEEWMYWEYSVKGL